MNDSNQHDARKRSPEPTFYIKHEPLDIDLDEEEAQMVFANDLQSEIMAVEDPLELKSSKRIKRPARLKTNRLRIVETNVKKVPAKRGRPIKVKDVSDQIVRCLKCPKKYCRFTCVSTDDLSSHMTRKHRKSNSDVKKRPPKKSGIDEKISDDNHEDSSPMPEVVDASGAVVKIEKSYNKGKLMYTCNRCKNSFCKLETAEAHIFKVHTNIKRYICSDCGRGFDRTLDLKEHTKVHTRERPFKCPVDNCVYTSAWSATMKKHVRRRHKDYQGELTLDTITEGRVKKRIKNNISVDTKDEIAKETETKPSIEDLSLILIPPVEDFESDTGQLNIFEENNIIDNRNNDISCYTCKICSKDFENLYSIKCHVNEEHRNLKKCTCMTCGIVLSNTGNLVVHMRSHSGERPFQCAECGKCFLSSSDLRRHSRRLQHASGLEKRQPKCIICKITLANQEELENHVSMHMKGVSDLKDSFKLTPYETAKLIISESDESHVFTCNICDTQFNDVLEAKEHVNHDHTIEKHNSCIYCGLTFPSRIAASRHKIVHDVKPLKCVNINCDYATTQYGHLQLHISQCANIVTPSTPEVRICNICKVEHADLNVLRVHFRMDHKLARSYSCLHCNYSYGSPGELTQHIESHGAVKSMDRCPMTNCQFIVTSVEDRIQHYRWHEKKINPSPRPFVCSICGKDFCVNSALLRHMRNVHSQNKH